MQCVGNSVRSHTTTLDTRLSSHGPRYATKFHVATIKYREATSLLSCESWDQQIPGMPYSLKGKNGLITGGSRGLGALICEKFAEEGANIMCNYVSAEDRAKGVQERCEKHGVKAFIIQGVRQNSCPDQSDQSRMWGSQKIML